MASHPQISGFILFSGRYPRTEPQKHRKRDPLRRKGRFKKIRFYLVVLPVTPEQAAPRRPPGLSICVSLRLWRTVPRGDKNGLKRAWGRGRAREHLLALPGHFSGLRPQEGTQKVLPNLTTIEGGTG